MPPRSTASWPLATLPAPGLRRQGQEVGHLVGHRRAVVVVLYVLFFVVLGGMGAMSNSGY